MKYTFLKQNRYRILLCEGHRYSRYMTVYNKEYWRCTDRSCKSKIHLNSGQIVYSNNVHNHRPDHKDISAQQAITVMRKRARLEEGTPFKKIYEETMQEFEMGGHGPIRESLTYERVLWEVMSQMDTSVHFEPKCQAAVETSTVEREVKQENEEDQFGDYSGFDLIDYSAKSNSDSSSLINDMSTSTASPNNNDATPSVIYSHPPAHSSQEEPAGTTANPGAELVQIDNPGLTIQNSYSLQTAPSNSNATHPVDLIPDPAEEDMYNSNGIPESSTKRLGKRGKSQVIHTNAGKSPFGVQPLRATLKPSTTCFIRRQPSSNFKVHSLSKVRPRPTASRPTASRLTASVPASTQRNLAGVPADDDKDYNQLRMQLARREHDLRLQQMRERHDAEMALVGLQQELVQEQLEALRQKQQGTTS